MVMGRRKFEIDWKKVNAMLEAGCSGSEIAAYFGMNQDTLYHRVEKEFQMPFSAYLQAKRSKGNSILKKVQYDCAIKEKDRAMLIWLGKQRLGQREKHETSNLIETLSQLKKSIEDGSFSKLLSQPEKNDNN